MEPDKAKILKEWYKLLQDGSITEEDFAKKKAELLQEREQTIKKIKINTDQLSDNLLKVKSSIVGWLKKYRIVLILILFLLAGLYAVYFFFLRNDPVKDAKRVMTTYCDCMDKQYESLINVNTVFGDSLFSYNFTTRQQARVKWGELKSAIFSQSQSCFENVETRRSNLRNKYTGLELYNFDLTYSQIASYKSKYYDKNQSLEAEISNKINAIKIPIPSIEKIKSDLIGVQTEFWEFTYLSNILSATIIDTIESSDRVELTIQLTLQGESIENYNAEIIVAYQLYYENWAYRSAKMNYITYEYTAPVGNWQPIYNLENATKTTVNYNGNKIWVLLPCTNEEFMQGPDVAFDGRYCSGNVMKYIKSREEKPVKITMMYISDNGNGITNLAGTQS